MENSFANSNIQIFIFSLRLLVVTKEKKQAEFPKFLIPPTAGIPPNP